MKFINGLHTDNDVLLQPPDTYRWLLNGELNKEKGAVVTEKGTIDLIQGTNWIPADFEVIGSVVLNDDRVVLFTTKSIAPFGESQIIVISSSGIIDLPLIHNTFLDFHPDSPIQAEFRVNIKGEIEVYWVRDNGPPGFLNVDNPPDNITFATVSLFPSVEFAPEFNFEQVNSTGGLLLSGAYQFALAYVADDGSATNFLNISNPIYISNQMDSVLNYDGSPPDTRTGSTIEFNVSNLDKDGFFGLRVVVIKDATTVTILPDRSIPNSAILHYTYTGGESYIPGSIDEVVIDKAVYTGAKAISQLDGVLYLGNLEKNQDIGYQKYANNIEVTVDTVHADPLPIVKPSNRIKKYLDPIYLHKFKTFRRGEVYALYISWLLKDGTESKAYHIPGRLTDDSNSNGEYDDITVGAIRDKIGKDIKDWQINSRMGTDVGDSGAVLNMGYWENENEYYPILADDDNLDYAVWDVDGTGTGFLPAVMDRKPALHGGRIRHHRMPENFDFPYYGLATDGGASNPELVKDGGFEDNDPGVWFPQIPWIIDGGEAQCTLIGLTNGYVELLQAVDLVAGTTYEVKFTITHTASENANIGVVLRGGTEVVHAVLPPPTDNVVLEVVAGADIGEHSFKIRAYDSILGTPFDGSIDDVSIKVKTTVSLSESSVLPLVPVIRNIKIPEYDGSPHQTGRNLHSEVIGYKVYYAKKNASNQLILDQASTLPVTKDGETSRHRQDSVGVGGGTGVYKNSGDVLLPHGYHKDFDLGGTGGIGDAIFTIYDTAFYIHPFSALKDEDSLSGTTFVKRVAIYSHYITPSKGTFEPHNWIRQWIEPQSFVYSAIGLNHAVKGIGFVPHNHGEVRLDEVNITLSGAVNRLNNTLAESKYVVELEDSLGGGEKYQVNLCQFRDDLHNDFDQQELVFTGILRTDVSSLGSGNAHQQDLIGGDIVITPYYFSAVSPWDVFTQPVIEEDPGYRGYQRVVADFPSVYSVGVTYEDFEDSAIIHPGLLPGFDKRLIDLLEVQPLDTLYDYVVAIGIPNFEIGEYTDNPLLRHRGEGGFEKYAKVGFEMEGEDWGYPAILDVTVPNITRFTNFPNFPKVHDFWIEWNTFFEQYDNYIGYNQYYSLVNSIKPAFPYGPSSEKTEVEDFSTRVIRSKKDLNSFASVSWRTFLENDRFDFARNKGEIIKLSTVQNRLVVHTEKTFHVMGSRSELVTSDQTAFIGSGDIFTVPPQEIIDTQGGYAGLQNPLGAIVSQFGYFFVDRSQKKAFIYDGKLKEISLVGIRNYLQGSIEANAKVIVGVENDQNRLFITHIGSTDWTISYLADVSMWESFHSYIPDHYIIGTTPFLSTKGRKIWQHGSGDVGKFYGTVYNFEIQFSDNLQPDLEKTASTLKIDTRVVSAVGVEDTEKTFDTFRIYNDRQDTTTKDINYFTGTDGNARRTMGRWSINSFRDETNIDGGSQIPSWAQRRRLNSKYNVVELVYTNVLNKKLSLIEAGIGYKPSNR